jgi:hypothetical protein
VRKAQAGDSNVWMCWFDGESGVSRVGFVVTGVEAENVTEPGSGCDLSFGFGFGSDSCFGFDLASDTEKNFDHVREQTQAATRRVTSESKRRAWVGAARMRTGAGVSW